MPPKNMLIVENDPQDAAIVADVARSLELSQIHAYVTASRALFHLEKGLLGEIALPDIIVLDLDLEHESGYDLLRFWRMTKKLSDIPMLVWSGLGDHHREICDIFKVNGFVGKWQGKGALKEGLLGCLERRSEA